jgi:hypothetical protein
MRPDHRALPAGAEMLHPEPASVGAADRHPRRPHGETGVPFDPHGRLSAVLKRRAARAGSLVFGDQAGRSRSRSTA